MKQLLARLFLKESQARMVTTFSQIGQPVNTPANYENFAKVGYNKNAIVYRCISMISSGGAGVNWSLYSGRRRKNVKVKEITEHPLLTLWEKPNPLYSNAAFVEACLAYYMLTGNSYIEANRAGGNGAPVEIWPMRPDRVKVIGGKNGYPAAYLFKNGDREKTFPVDFVSLKGDVLHWKTWHPLNDWYGMSPIEAAMQSLDQNNAAQRWNLALLQNGASPSGVLQMKESAANPRGELTEQQYARLKAEFEEHYQGARNAGKPLIIEGGLQWQTVSLSPKDMDWINNKQVSATDVAQVFGVPPELLGLGQKTFNNYKEARAALYEETILPLLDGYRDHLNHWLAPAFGENLWLDYDKDDIEAISWKRDERYTSFANVNFLTQNEKREAMGHEHAEGWDVFVIGNQIGEAPEDFAGGPTDPNQEDQESEQDSEAVDEAADADREEGAATDDGDDTSDADPKPGKPKPPAKPGKPAKGKSDGASLAEELADRAAENGVRGSIKSINRLNRREKLQSWRHQNLRRKRLASDFERDLGGDLRELASALGEAAKGVAGSADARLKEFAILHAGDEFLNTHVRQTIKRHVRRAVDDFGHMILEDAKSLEGYVETKANRKFKDFVDRYVEARTGDAIKHITGTTHKQVRTIVKEWTQEALDAGDSAADLSKYLQMEFEGLSDGRARNIARTEVAVASNNGAREAVKSLGIPGMQKEWVTAEDGRVRDGEPRGHGPDHASMDGVTVDLDEKFNVPPDADMDGPGDQSAEAAQVCNCRCVLVYKAGDET